MRKPTRSPGWEGWELGCVLGARAVIFRWHSVDPSSQRSVGACSARDLCEAGDSPALRVRTAGRAFGGQGPRGPAEWDSPGAGRGRGSAERAIRGADTANNK